MEKEKETTVEETTVEETVNVDEVTVDEVTVAEATPYVQEIIEGLSLDRPSLEKFMSGNKVEAYESNREEIDNYVKAEIKSYLPAFGCAGKSKVNECHEQMLEHYATKLSDTKKKSFIDIFVNVARDGINPFVAPIPIQLSFDNYGTKRPDATERARKGETLTGNFTLAREEKLVEDKEKGTVEIKTIYKLNLLP
jgi:hypothetical protein